MTEQEAKEKWCPMVRVSSDPNQIHEHCIASSCMMWRSTRTVDGALDGGGYCGLAGHIDARG